MTRLKSLGWLQDGAKAWTVKATGAQGQGQGQQQQVVMGGRSKN
jgi:hypothetical protein